MNKKQQRLEEYEAKLKGMDDIAFLYYHREVIERKILIMKDIPAMEGIAKNLIYLSELRLRKMEGVNTVRQVDNLLIWKSEGYVPYINNLNLEELQEHIKQRSENRPRQCGFTESNFMIDNLLLSRLTELSIVSESVHNKKK